MLQGWICEQIYEETLWSLAERNKNWMIPLCSTKYLDGLFLGYEGEVDGTEVGDKARKKTVLRIALTKQKKIC